MISKDRKAGKKAETKATAGPSLPTTINQMEEVDDTASNIDPSLLDYGEFDFFTFSASLILLTIY